MFQSPSMPTRFLPITKPVRGEFLFRDETSTAAPSSSHEDMDSGTPHPMKTTCCSSSDDSAELMNTVPSVFLRRGRRSLLRDPRSAVLVNDIPATKPCRRQSLGMVNPLERPAPLAPVVRDPSLTRIDLEDDDDEEEYLCTTTTTSTRSSIPSREPIIVEGHNSSSTLQSSFRSVFGARENADFPLARPSRSLSPSPMVSPTGRCNVSGYMASPALVSPTRSIAGFCSYLDLSDSME